MLSGRAVFIVYNMTEVERERRGRGRERGGGGERGKARVRERLTHSCVELSLASPS